MGQGPSLQASVPRPLRLELQGAEHAKMFTVAKSVSFDILGDVADAMAPIAGHLLKPVESVYHRERPWISPRTPIGEAP